MVGCWWWDLMLRMFSETVRIRGAKVLPGSSHRIRRASRSSIVCLGEKNAFWSETSFIAVRSEMKTTVG